MTRATDAATMRFAPVVMRTCTWCKVEFPDGYQDPAYPRWCSTRCYQQQWRAAKDMDHVPLEWDGKTQYSEPPEPEIPYVAVCITCGAEAFYRLTRHIAALASRAGLKPCDVCGGWRQLLRMEFGQTGATQARIAYHVPSLAGRYRMAS